MCLNMKITIQFIFCLMIGFTAQAQNINLSASENTVESGYQGPQDPQVIKNLTAWQGDKFGIIVHMGLYSELGTVESWGLCPEDWVSRDGYDDYYKYASDYRNTRTRFNPVNFDAGKWAGLFKSAGARYMIFTSKHHDGFCMYDSKFTNFKIADKSCPYASQAHPDILRRVLDASRTEGLKVGIYFSKPDWSSQDFWWSYYPPKDRNPTYDITKHPDRWQRYIDYTHNQIDELTSDYGKVDILWLDGCWVMPKSSITKKVEEFCKYPHDMDINMKLIAEKARKKQPGMLVVDRWVQSAYEDYLTPEQKTPEKPLSVPWESCITMGGAWGWVPGDHYKSSAEIIQLLVRIVSKGGNLLLGIGPNGKGEFEPEIYKNLAMVGKWLEQNGVAIYGTTPQEPFLEGKLAYTQKGGDAFYAIYLPDKDEKEMPETITVKTQQKGKFRVSLTAGNVKLKSVPVKDGIMVSIPYKMRKSLAGKEAVAFTISKQ